MSNPARRVNGGRGRAGEKPAGKEGYAGLRRGGRAGGWWRELRAVADRVGAVEGNN